MISTPNIMYISHRDANKTRESVPTPPNIFPKTHFIWPGNNISVPTTQMTTMFLANHFQLEDQPPTNYHNFLSTTGRQEASP
jgi:hypothetical protein